MATCSRCGQIVGRDNTHHAQVCSNLPVPVELAGYFRENCYETSTTLAQHYGVRQREVRRRLLLGGMAREEIESLDKMRQNDTIHGNIFPCTHCFILTTDCFDGVPESWQPATNGRIGTLCVPCATGR